MITSRDRLLLSTLHSYGLLSTVQLRTIVFPNIRDTTALRRIRALESLGLIERHSGLEGGQWAWTIARNGAHLMGEDPTVHHVNKNKLNHDVTVADVRMALEKTGQTKGWMSGHKLLSDAGKNMDRETFKQTAIPDGLFSIETKPGRRVVALEVELIAKTAERYTKVFESYREKKGVALVLYVVPIEAIAKKVLAAAKKTEVGDFGVQVVWASLDDVLANSQSFVIRSLLGEVRFSDLVVQPKPVVVKAVTSECSVTPAQTRDQVVSR